MGYNIKKLFRGKEYVVLSFLIYDNNIYNNTPHHRYNIQQHTTQHTTQNKTKTTTTTTTQTSRTKQRQQHTDRRRGTTLHPHILATPPPPHAKLLKK